MASVLPYRPPTGGAGAANTSKDARSVSTISYPSIRTLSSPSTIERDSGPLGQPPDTARSAFFSFSRTAMPPQHSMIRKRKRKVYSQYPTDSEEKHVEYILVASFDIDQGSIMEHQYPEPIGGNENMLAELMLPDQAHMRAQDWTIFFLHKDGSEDDTVRRERLETRKMAREERLRKKESAENRGDDEDEDAEDSDEEMLLEDEALENAAGSPIFHVLNLVTTKQDNTVRRGAVCKAMAICTRHPFLHIYKPLLLLALEDYFRNPVPNTLATFYNSLNAMDLSLMPRLSRMERLLLQASDIRDMYAERFEALAAARGIQLSTPDTLASPISINPMSATLPRDTHEFGTVLPYNGAPIPVKVPTALTQEVVGDFSVVQLVQTFSQPHATSPQPWTRLHPHLTSSGSTTHPIMVLLNAIITGKRVVFLGHNLPSSTVAETVLAACALASGGLLRGFVRHAFPYTDLTKIDDLLKVSGFIAGVTNPTFLMHDDWWDLLCDLNTGRMTISSSIEAAPVTEGMALIQSGAFGGVEKNGVASSKTGNSSPLTLDGDATGDNAFMSAVLAAIAERRGESAIRAQFRNWIYQFIRKAAAYEELVYGRSTLTPLTPDPEHAPSPGSTSPTLKRSPSDTTLSTSAEITKGYGYVWPTLADKNRELAANATRIEGWLQTQSYYNYIQDAAVTASYAPVKALDLQHCHDKLAKLRLGPDNAAHLYLALAAAVVDRPQIDALLVVLAYSAPLAAPGGGQGQRPQPALFHVALGLLHPRPEVRERVAELLGRIREHEAGRHFWARLSGFEKAAFERVEAARREREA